MENRPVPLLRSNRNFRLLWLGQVVSQMGDWFNYVALYALLFELTGSARVVATLMVAQILPIALVGPHRRRHRSIASTGAAS